MDRVPKNMSANIATNLPIARRSVGSARGCQAAWKSLAAKPSGQALVEALLR